MCTFILLAAHCRLSNPEIGVVASSLTRAIKAVSYDLVSKQRGLDQLFRLHESCVESLPN
jgi:uncharacterized Fe-S center protein